MAEPQRWLPNPDAAGWMQPNEYGAWVRYEDALAMVEEAVRAERERIEKRLSLARTEVAGATTDERCVWRKALAAVREETP